MPRKTATTIPDQTGPVMTPLDAIPDELKQFVEEIYAKQRVTPSRERIEYDTEAEMKAEFKLMADYVAQRKVNGKLAALRIRRSPTRNMPDNFMDIRITADLEANGAANANADANKDSAKK